MERRGPAHLHPPSHALALPRKVPCIRSAWEHVLEERAHTASAAALAEAAEHLARLAATPPLPEHAVWAAGAAELERGALEAFDARALAGAAAAAARHAPRGQGDGSTGGSDGGTQRVD